MTQIEFRISPAEEFHRTPLLGTRFRRTVALTVVLLVVLGLALVGAVRFVEGRSTGKALEPSGLILDGVVGPELSVVKPGKTYGFAFPLMTNKTSRVVRILGVQVNDVAPNVQVTGYRLLSADDTPGYLLSSYVGDRSSGDYGRYPNHLRNAVIAPHQLSVYYPVVYLVPRGPVVAHTTGCQVNYAIGHRKYHQVFDCEFSLSGT